MKRWLGRVISGHVVALDRGLLLLLRVCGVDKKRLKHKCFLFDLGANP